jgi:DNA polymerase-3 subunit alpha
MVKTEELFQYLPEFEIPAAFKCADEYIRHIALDGLVKRFPNENEAQDDKWNILKERLEYELDNDPKTALITTQYEMNYLEKCGLVKFNLLGLKTLDEIKYTVELIRSRGGEFANFSIENIPEDDPATFELIQEGKTEGVFQFESEGMQNILRLAKPSNMLDLIAINALYRPGPMDNLPQFINFKNGELKPHYLEPCLENILKETHGILVYQEQVMKIIQLIAGYSLARAELLRRVMGKGDTETIEKERIIFLEGATKQGFSEDRAVEIFKLLIPFGRYTFNKTKLGEL